MQTGKYNQSKRNRTTFVLAVLSTLALVLPAAAQPELVPVKPSDERPLLDNPAAGWGADYTNWVEVGIGNVWVDGHKSSFQSRDQLPGNVFGGLEALHYERPVTKDWLLQIDGRAIANNEDYLGKVTLVNPKVGFVRGGYREFRTWYDRHGGYSSLGNVWIEPFDRNVHIDRGEAFFEGGLTLENVPKLTFGYTRMFRDGIKDSTSWGDATVATGTRRAIVPSFWDIDENRDIFRADLAHSIGKTDFGVGLRYEMSDQKNEKDILRRPGDRTAGQSITRAVTQNDNLDTDMFNVHGFTQTRINEKVLFTTGGSFTELHADTAGSRIYGSDFDAIYDPNLSRRQQRDEGFTGLAGSGDMKEYVANLNLLVSPWEYISILPSVRIDKVDETAVANFTGTDWPNADLNFVQTFG
ncbi:MAG: hypothetical protein LUO89_11100, partial [Methanothrix sp.]|nr:hypothetical protein [Methanothrix sp.]